MPDNPLQTAVSVFGNTIRVIARQWAHVTEAHDHMSGNMDKVLETLAEPELVLEGSGGESPALRNYASTAITRETAVVAYRDEPDGFLITTFFTSRPDKMVRTGRLLWARSQES